MATIDPSFQQRRATILGTGASTPALSSGGRGIDPSFQQRRTQILSTPVKKTTPTSAPLVAPKPVAKQSPTLVQQAQKTANNIGETIKKTIGNITVSLTKSKITPSQEKALQPVKTAGPIQIKPGQTKIDPKLLQQKLSSLDSGGVSGQSALMTPQAQAVAQKRVGPVVEAVSKFNPIDTAITAGQNILAKQAEELSTGKANGPKLVQSLAFYQKLTEPLLKNKYTRNIVRAEAQQILGSSQKIQDMFNTPLDKPTTIGDQAVATGTEMLVGLGNLMIGGKGLEALGVAKAKALPLLFATLGQLGAGPQTTINQRLAKMPVDYLTGWLFNLVPGSKKLFSKETLKGMGLVGVITAPTSFISYLTEGMNPKDAAITALKASVINAAFHAVMIGQQRAGAKLFGEQRVYSTDTPITPEEAQSRGIPGEVIQKAKTQGKNIQAQAVVVKEGVLTKKDIVSAETLKKLGIEVPTIEGKPEGYKIEFNFVDKPTIDSLPTGEQTPQEVIGKILQAGLDKTPEGKELIKTALQAQEQGQTITIEGVAKVTPEIKKTTEIFHSGNRTPEQVKTEGLNVSRSPAKDLGSAVYFSDSKEGSTEYGGNIQATVNPNDFNLKTITTLPEQQAFIKEMGVSNLADAIKKEGKYDGFIIPNADPKVGTTYGITNLDKVNQMVRGEKTTSLPSPTKGVAPSEAQKVVQGSDRGGVKIVTDPSQVQEIRNSIAEGEGYLSTGKGAGGNKLTEEDIKRIVRAVNNSRAKIGLAPYGEKKLVLKPTDADTTKKILAEVEKLGLPERVVRKIWGRTGDNAVVYNEPRIRKADFKTFAQNSKEFKKNPVLVVDKNKNLVFKSKDFNFSVTPEDVQLSRERLQEGDKITVDLEGLKGKAQQMRVYNSGNTYADAGGYADVKSAEKTVKDIKSIEFPELLSIAKELLGHTPTLKKSLHYLGVFMHTPGSKTIKLNYEIFKDPILAAKVFAHEIGHLTDFLPDNTMKRGNLLGRIASLVSYHKSFLEEAPGIEKGLLTDKDRKRLRDEAKRLAQQPIKVEKEILVGEIAATPEQVKAIWNDLDAPKKFPELLKYIQTLSQAQKWEIVKEAMKGVIPKWVNFKTYSKKTVVEELIKNAPEDIKKLYDKLLREEIAKRNQFFVKEVREELKKMTQIWKPFVEDLVPPGYKAYRYSGKELYADAISVLFNDPALLKQTAPEFYRGFFNYLDNKPAAKNVFEDIWTLLNKGEDAVFQKRDEDLSRSFSEGEKAFTAKYLDKQKRQTSLLYHIKLLFDDVNTPILDRIAQVRKRGGVVPADLNPDYALKGILYGEGELKNYVEDKFQPIFEKVHEVQDGWNKLGKMVFLERVINERGELANPLGYDPKTASTQLKKMEEAMSETDRKKMNEAKDLFRKAVQESVDFAEKNGYYTPELIKQIKANPSYASFQVVDYLDTYITARVYKQKGTLKDIANPATSTVMKLISMRRAIKRNNAKKLGMQFMEKEFSSEIEKAHTKWNGRSMEIKPPKDPQQELILTIEDGKPAGYYVPRDVAEVFNYTPNSLLEGAAKIARVVSQGKFYRPLFTMYNLGFQTANFVRDFRRTWKTMPNRTLGEMIASPVVDFIKVGQGYLKAIGPAYNRTVGNKDAIIKEMENLGILGISYNDIYSGEVDTDAQQIERIMQETGVLPIEKKRNLLAPLTWILDRIGATGDFIETLPKVAGYKQLKGTMPEKELADYVRSSIGSPAFRVGGKATPITNAIFLFSNAQKEGIKTDLQVGTGHRGKYTAGGYWWKTVISDLLPKFLMAGIAAGLFGEKMKELMDKQSEYDKTNYTVIPIGEDKNGKSISFRIPHDETGRFLAGILWKILNINRNAQPLVQNITDIVNTFAGQAPNLSPTFTGLGAVAQYLSGKNPYDTFRSRYIIPDTEFKAGYKYSAPIFLNWLMQNQGLGVVTPSFSVDNPTDLEKIMQLPVAGNVLSRWIKSSDYGETEKLTQQSKAADQISAERLLKERKIIDEGIAAYRKNPTRQNMIEQEKKAVKSIVEDSGLSGEAARTKATNTLKKFKIGVLYKNVSPQLDSLISSTSNEEKVQKLLIIRKQVTKSELDQIFRIARENKIISNNVILEYRKRSK